MANSARIDELEKKFSENARRYFAPLANEYRKAGDLDRAIEICRAHLPQQPGHMSGHVVYGQALYESRQWMRPRRVRVRARPDPENLIALRHLGDIARDRATPRTGEGLYIACSTPTRETTKSRACWLSSMPRRRSQRGPSPPLTSPRCHWGRHQTWRARGRDRGRRGSAATDSESAPIEHPSRTSLMLNPLKCRNRQRPSLRAALIGRRNGPEEAIGRRGAEGERERTESPEAALFAARLQPPSPVSRSMLNDAFSAEADTQEYGSTGSSSRTERAQIHPFDRLSAHP